MDASVEVDTGLGIAVDVLVAVVVFGVSHCVIICYIALRCACNRPIRFDIRFERCVAVVEVVDYGAVEDEVGGGDAVIEGF